VPARLLAALTWTALITACSEEVRVGSWSEVTPLPMPVANNATASLLLPMGPVLFSFLGLDTTKAFSGITQRAFAYEVDADRWRELSPVPGPEGRLAATAVGFGGRILLFGGYTVDAEGGEVSAPDLDIFDPQTDAWLEGEPFPLPVDDAVSGVWRDSLVFVVSGWSQRDNVDAVQIYDPADDRWGAATPIPGPPVFGHAGAILGDAIVYCDGVRIDRSHDPGFVMAEACYRGDIHPADPARIDWRQLSRHPGPARYRMAAAALPDAGLVVFAGGTDNPYNYDGVGYDGVPSEPSALAFAYDVANDSWIELADKVTATMDHRDLAVAGNSLYVIGGMTRGQRVTARVERLELAH
jgi:N-acetylneuraminic acid mutarotase